MAAKKKPKRDACYKKVKARYTKGGGTWPSAYGSGALVKCRKVGAKKRKSSGNSLKDWFGQNKGKGWVNCKTGGPCGRKSKKSGGAYPACRPTMAQCKSKAGKAATKRKTSAKRVNWKKKKKK
jgi:hypothetical protein